MQLKKSFLLRTAWSIGISLLIVGLIMRYSFGEDAATRPQLLLILRRTSPSLVAFYLLFSLTQALVRAIRYRSLIRAAQEPAVPSLAHTFLVTLARNMFVDLLPARTGELSYVAMMNRGYRVSGQACLSSLSISFLFDLIALILLIAGLAVFQLATTQPQGWILVMLVLLSVVIGGLAIALFAGIRPAARIARRLMGSRAELPWMAASLRFLERLADAMDFTRRSGALPHVLFLSLLVRLAKYSGLACLFYAVVNPSFPGLAGASPLDVLFTLVSAEAGASLPIPAFMSFGTYEAGGLLTLTLLGFSATASKVAMFAIHIWSQCIDYALGGLGLVLFVILATPRSSRTAAYRKRARQTAWIALAALVVVVGLGFAAYQVRKIRKLGALAPPQKGAAVEATPEEQARLTALARRLTGFAVWSSNRFGSHDILMMTFPDRALVALTTHPHVDTFPRISPDGTRIAFCRSQQPWVSQRNDIPWDVYVLDLTDHSESLVATHANVPTWSDAGDAIYFQRHGMQFVEHDLATGTERILFQSGAGHVPEGVHLHTPSFSSRYNAMAVTLRGRARNTVVYFADEREPISIARSACQLAWAPDDSFLYYVDHGGKQTTAFYRCEPNGANRHLWLDLPGTHSHEYFPRVSNDKRYLVFGASTGGHEHDTADYEIFIWPTGAPATHAARLTFHSGNDCWPDLWIAGHGRGSWNKGNDPETK